MRFFSIDKILKDKNLQTEIVQCIKKGYVFFYPTDTVYGFGCDATKREAVGRIRSIKGTDHPFSVIAPSKEWIVKNLIVSDTSTLDNLPGSFTLIFRKKSANLLENICRSNSIGVRIPDHPLTEIIQRSEKPFVTTSANISGQPTILNAAEIPRDIARELDIIIDAGELSNPPSTIIDCTEIDHKVVERK